MENPFAAGVVVGARWQVTEPLGQSIFGEAYLVTDRASDRGSEASMRVWEQTTTPKRHETFGLRMKQLALTEHTNLAAYLDYGEHINGSESRKYFVNELCDTSLEAHLHTQKASRLHTLEVYHLLQDLVDGLVFLHDRNIVHRNINPSTVVNCDGIWKLAEFGLRPEATGSIVSMFAAPELATEAEQTTSSDVFALGVLGLLCSTGNPTPEGAPDVPVIGSAELVPQTDQPIDPFLRDLLRQSTQPNPANRVTAKQLQRLLKSS